MAGLLPPCWAVNERLLGLAPIAGVAVTVKLTGMSCGVFVAPEAAIEIVPACVPGVSPAGFTLTVTVPALVPVADVAPLTLSHAIFEEAVQLRVPVPAFVIVTDWLAGAVPF